MKLFVWNSEEREVQPASGIAKIKAGAQSEFCVQYKDEGSRCTILFINAVSRERAEELVKESRSE